MADPWDDPAQLAALMQRPDMRARLANAALGMPTGDPNALLAASMTHWPETPNPAAPYVAAVKELNPFGGRGVSEILKQQGFQLPEWSNRVGDVLQSDAANTAMGMATPLKGTTTFPQRIGDLVRQLPDTAPHQGKVAIGEVYDAYRQTYPRDYQSSKTFGHRLVNAAKAQEIGLDRLDLPETMDHDLRLRSTTPWGDDTVHFVRRPSAPAGIGPASEPTPLERQVIERGRSGRPIATEPLPIGTENSILEEGLSGWKERKRDYAYAQSPESHAIEAFQNDRSRAEIAARGREIPEYLKNGATAADLSPEGRTIYNQLIDFSKRSDLPKIR